jgi:hypothetical protein
MDELTRRGMLGLCAAAGLSAVGAEACADGDKPPGPPPRQLLYAMQWKGQGTPVTGTNRLKIASKATSCVFTTVVEYDGLSSTVLPVAGATASFESEATFTGETSFQEVGAIKFANGSSIQFKSLSDGFLAPSASSKLKHGAVIFRIDGGEEAFDGASGLIASNFTVGEAGEVTENQLGIIFLK